MLAFGADIQTTVGLGISAANKEKIPEFQKYTRDLFYLIL